MSTYFAGVILGGYVVLKEYMQLDVYLAFIGAPAATSLGWYYWKAKNENMKKIDANNLNNEEENPDE